MAEQRYSASQRRQALVAILCLAVAWIHVQDQGGFPGNKTPGYVGMGYYALEFTGIVCSLIITARGRFSTHPIVWLTAAGVALGPLLGYILSRGPGLPGYTDDRGNWSEPLGMVSIGVEVLLLCIALSLLRERRESTARKWSDTNLQAPGSRPQMARSDER
ncbi:hypothetical protein [Streptacidiphilus sp. EB129]|uniref:hypothetical protein n=1 Tax=Streptacidiphilus sp. EB129 TaxID=3156262 RepID=UPI003513FB60